MTARKTGPVAKSTGAASPVPGKIKGTAKEVHEEILARRKPSLRLPIRSLANVRYAVQKGFFELKSGRKGLEKRTRKLRSEVLGSPALKRLETLRKDVQQQLTDTADNLLRLLQIASRSDVERIDRKLSQLSRKLREIEEGRASHRSESASA